MLQRVSLRASCRGFTPYHYDLEILVEKAQYDLFRHSCHKGHCLNHLYMVYLRPSDAMRLRMRGYDYEMKLRCSFPFSLCVIFVWFYCHCAVSLFKCYSVNMCDCHV